MEKEEKGSRKKEKEVERKRGADEQKSKREKRAKEEGGNGRVEVMAEGGFWRIRDL